MNVWIHTRLRFATAFVCFSFRFILLRLRFAFIIFRLFMFCKSGNVSKQRQRHTYMHTYIQTHTHTHAYAHTRQTHTNFLFTFPLQHHFLKTFQPLTLPSLLHLFSNIYTFIFFFFKVVLMSVFVVQLIIFHFGGFMETQGQDFHIFQGCLNGNLFIFVKLLLRPLF